MFVFVSFFVIYLFIHSFIIFCKSKSFFTDLIFFNISLNKSDFKMYKNSFRI